MHIDVGFCDAEITQSQLFSYFWPEVEAGTTASLPCGLGPIVPSGMARRTCNPDTVEWDPISMDECFACEYDSCQSLCTCTFHMTFFVHI